MKEFDLYIDKLNAITKKYNNSPLLEQTDIDWDFTSSITRLLNKANKGVNIYERNVTEKDIYNLADLEDIFGIFTFGDLSKLVTTSGTLITLKEIKIIHRWVNISVWNAEPGAKRHSYGMPAGLSIGDAAQGSEEELKARYGPNATKGNVWKTLTTRTKLINNIVAKVESGTYLAREPQTQKPFYTGTGQSLTLQDIQKANREAQKSDKGMSIFQALKTATGKDFTIQDLADLVDEIDDTSAATATYLNTLWNEAETYIDKLQSPRSTNNPNGWKDRPPHDYGLGKMGLESLTVADAFRGFENRDVESAYTDLANWASRPRENGTSWREDMQAVLPTMIEIAIAVTTMSTYQNEFELSEEEKRILLAKTRALAWREHARYIAKKLAELRQQKRMAASAEIAQQRFNVRDKLIGQTAQKQRINNQISTAARKINNASAATPSGGYMPHPILGGARELVSVYFVAHPEVKKAFSWLSVAQNLIEPESSTTDTVTKNVLGDPITLEDPINDSLNEDVEKPAKNRPANILQHNFRKKAIEDLKKAYVKLKANELFFTKQVEPYSQGGRVTKSMLVYYGIDATDLENVMISSGGKIDESLVYGLTEATQQVLELYAVTIPTIIRNSKAQVGSLKNAEKSKKLFNNPPNIEINYADLDAQAETRANLLYSARDDLIAQEEADRQKQEEREKWIELQDKIQNFRAADQASMENWREYEQQLQNERIETFREADKVSMENWKIFQTKRDAINLWNRIRAPFDRSLLFYDRTGVSPNQIAELKNQWDAALASNMVRFINPADELVYETIKNGIDEIDEKFTNTINSVLPQLERKVDVYDSKIEKQEKLYQRDPRLVDRAILFAGPQNRLEAEVNELEGSDIARYMDFRKLAEIKGVLQTTSAKLEKLQKGFKLYDDPFMETFRQLDNLALRLILSDEPFYKAQSLNQYAYLYDKLIKLMPETKNKFSQFTYNDIILKKRDDITALTKTVFRKKMNDFWKQDIYQFFESVPMRHWTKSKDTGRFIGTKWLSYGIHKLMDKKSEYDRLVTEIKNLESVQEQINATMKTFTKDRLPTTDIFKLLFEKERWKKLPELFDNIKLLNDKREGKPVNYNEFKKYIHQLIDSVEFLDFVVAEYLYSEKTYPKKPHSNPVIQSAFEALNSAPYKNQFALSTTGQLRKADIAFKEDGTGVWDILLRDYPKTGRNKYDKILKSQDNKVWEKGNTIGKDSWDGRNITGYDSDEVEKDD